MVEDITSIACGWIMEQSTQNADLPDKSRKFAYYDKLADLVADEPTKALEVVLEMLRITADEVTISNIAAGPLEDLIARNGPALIDLIESEAKQNRKLRYALRGVWKNLSDDDVWRRIEQARNVP